jgi:hypothetical protein
LASGRKYGRLAYGKYSYDLWPSWKPIPPQPPVDVWVPTPGLPPDGWGSVTPPFNCGAADIWNPTAPVANNWAGATVTLPETWIPVTKPVLNG